MASRVVPGAITLLLIASACSGSDDVASSTTTAVTLSTTTTPVTTAPVTTAPVMGTAALDLERTLQEFVGDGPGGAIALLRRSGVTTIEAVGVADASGTPLRTDQPMRVGSISKPFVAVLVLQLVDEQLVELDERLDTYLPETLVGAGVTIAELLSHRSGIPSYTDNPALFAEAFGDLQRVFTPDDILAYVIDLGPGRRGAFSYSNTNFLLLGQLIEAVDGGDLGASLERRITAPLGLADTWFETQERPAPADLAAGWSLGIFEGDRDTPYTAVSSGAWAAGALISTVGDLATFLDALVGGRLLSDDSFTAMTDTGASGYGLGIRVAGLGAAGSGWAHNGAIPGYHSTIGISSDGGVAIAITTNADRLIADDLASRILLQL